MLIKRTTANVDWLSCTFKKNVMPTWFIPSSEWNTTKASFGYTDAIISDTGIVVMSNDNRPDMGNHVIVSATAAAHLLFMHNMDFITLLKTFIGRKGKVTRIDLYIDAHNYGLDINQLAVEFKDDLCKTRARSGRVINGIKDAGQTLYVGKRGSRQMLRVYNKAAEQEIDGDWIRIEIELRKDVAVSAAAELIFAESNWRLKIPALIQGFASFPDGVWTAIMGADVIHPPKQAKIVSKTRLWLIDVVALAMAKLVISGDSLITEDFHHKVVSEIIRLKSVHG